MHPLMADRKLRAIVRFLKYQLILRLNKGPIIYPYVNDSKILVKHGMQGITMNCYVGLAEFEEMSFLLHLLRKDDFFIDIGAYVGTYTILASAVAKARTLSIEPIPSSFSFLLKNIRINGVEDKVKALRIGLGSKEEILFFTSRLDSRNRVIREGESFKNKIRISIKRLDDIVNSEGIPTLLKIDTEGFENEIIKGAEKVLSHKDLKAIIIELWKREKIHNKLISKNFCLYSYNPFIRELIESQYFTKNTVIYIRDLDFVKKRVKETPKFKVLDKYI